ncbi:DUF6887 family protein [Crocosphaera subtropica]|nr:hypothetical protein [Crocosphaera subtropica]
MKIDFSAMSTPELRRYVLQNRDDKPAFYALMDRLNSNTSTTSYPCPNTPENIEIMKQAIRKKLNQIQ